MKEEAFAIKVEVLEAFTYSKYNEIAESVERKNRSEYGTLYIGDTFYCNKEEAEYLLDNNKMKRAFVRVIEIGGQNGK